MVEKKGIFDTIEQKDNSMQICGTGAYRVAGLTGLKHQLTHRAFPACLQPLLFILFIFQCYSTSKQNICLFYRAFKSAQAVSFVGTSVYLDGEDIKLKAQQETPSRGVKSRLAGFV